MVGLVSRAVVIPRLGVGGRRTDVPTWDLGPRDLADGSQDAVIHEGAVRRRRGVPGVPHPPAAGTGRYEAVYRARFALAGRTATLVVARQDGHEFPRHRIYDVSPNDYQGSAQPLSVESISPSTEPVLPRAMYRDGLIFCDQNGFSPIMRYSGGVRRENVNITGKTAVGRATLSATPKGRGGVTAMFHSVGRAITGVLSNPFAHPRILSASPAEATVTMEDMRASALIDFFPDDYSAHHCATTVPCVGIHSAGTVSLDGPTSVATGAGTNWTDLRGVDGGGGAGGESFGMLVDDAGVHRHYLVGGAKITSDTSLPVFGANGTNLNYQITARCPFKDVCVHTERLYGIGVKGFPSRVYVGPADWNMAWPPGATLPHDPTVEFKSASRADHLLDFIDVPSPQDSDEGVAILATDGPRILLKQKSVWYIHGDVPNLDPELAHSGDGCVDRRGAISVNAGAFWAGRGGIYRYRGGQVAELTGGWMSSEWRALVDSGIDYCSLGVDGRHLVVSIKTADARQEKRTYLYDLELGRWLPEVTNLYPHHMFTANVTGEIQALLCVDAARPGKILNLSPALNLTGPARDEEGTGPSFRLVTGDSLAGGEGVEGELHVLEASVHANIRDSGGATTVTVKATSGGAARGNGAAAYGTGLYGTAVYGPDGVKTLGSIQGDAGDRLARREFPVNRPARRFGLTLEETTTSQTVETLEVGAAVIRFRDKRRGT